MLSAGRLDAEVKRLEDGLQAQALDAKMRFQTLSPKPEALYPRP